MANKQLTAKVRLDASSAHRSLDKLIEKIKRVEELIRKPGNVSGLEKKIERALLQQEKLRQATLKTHTAEEKLTTQTQKSVEASNKAKLAEERLTAQKQKTALIAQKVSEATNKVRNNQSDLNNKLSTTNSLFGKIWDKLKGIAATYLGIMGTKAVVNTTDVLIGAQNRLNYVASQQLGDAGFNEDDSYSAATLNATQDAIDKMYVSSQKARTSYSEMMSNVSKTMALAGGAFDNNIDNAIRFQEIMAEAYAVGGATAQEMKSSMYQMTQALGAGILAGDELRSVREGAPLAYQAIERFAQKLHDTDDSLKEMASDGLITADIVVAAIMDAGSTMDNAFEQTAQTFGQTMNQIKTAAMYSFQPVMEKLKNALNDAVENGMVQKFEQFFTNVAKAVLIVFEVISNVVNWMADNWVWLQYIVYGVVAAIIAYLGLLAATAIKTAIKTWIEFFTKNPFLIWIITITLVIAALAWLLQAFETGCEFIYNVAMALAMAIVGVLAVVLTAYIATGTVMLSIPMIIGLMIIAVLALLIAAFVKWTGQIVGFAYGMKEAIGAIFTNIKLAFQNILLAMKHLFWTWIDGIVSDFKPLLEVVNSILTALNKPTISVDLDFAANKAKGFAEEIGYVSVSDAYKSGYSSGFAVGENIQDNINGFADKIKGLGTFNKSGVGALDAIGQKLGLDFSGMGTFPTEGVGTPEADYGKLLDSIDGNTDKIADSMELTKEDLEYLRKLANMGWTNKFTTASVNVTMTNNNTVNNDYDLKSLAIGLRDMCEEEMFALADGVYA